MVAEVSCFGQQGSCRSHTAHLLMAVEDCDDEPKVMIQNPHQSYGFAVGLHGLLSNLCYYHIRVLMQVHLSSVSMQQQKTPWLEVLRDCMEMQKILIPREVFWSQSVLSVCVAQASFASTHPHYHPHCSLGCWKYLSTWVSWES